MQRRNFFSSLISAGISLGESAKNPYIFQGIEYNLTSAMHSPETQTIFTDTPICPDFFPQSTVLFFPEFPSRKTDIFFQELKKKHQIKTDTQVIITKNKELFSQKNFDKGVWIYEKSNQNLQGDFSDIPLLVITTPKFTPGIDMANLPDGSDIFIGTNNSFIQEEAPALMRLKTFLNGD